MVARTALMVKAVVSREAMTMGVMAGAGAMALSLDGLRQVAG